MKEKINGITLIALVVTIVVLIILATISINAVFGENGLIKRAEAAKKLHEQATEDEQVGLQGIDKYLGNMINGSITGNDTENGRPEKPINMKTFTVVDGEETKIYQYIERTNLGRMDIFGSGTERKTSV